MSRLTFKNYFAEAQLFNRRVFIALLFISLLSALLLGRLFYLQIIEHKFYTTLSEANQMNLIPIDPPRGLIYDRNGVILAQNYPAFSLDIIPDRVRNFKDLVARLHTIIDISPDDIQQYQKALKQRRPFEPVPLKIKLTDEEVAKFYLNQYRFPGAMINARMIRYYPMGKDMVTPLGYVARINEQEAKKVDAVNYSATDYIGKIGIEKHYENILHGTVGYQQVEIDASGRIVRTLKRIPPIPGDNIYLTIDSKLQQVAEKAIGENEGAIVAIQPSTGEILALASQPNYDPNLFVKGISAKDYKALQDEPARPLYNRAVRGIYPTGSTIKPFFALQGLDTKTVDINFEIADPGWFKIPGNSRIFRDWNLVGHGMVNIQKAIVVSCDVYFWTLAMKMGIDKMDSILDRLGFGKRTGIDVDEDLPGILPSPAWKRAVRGEGWYTGDTINLGIGQGFIGATPLQLAKAVAIIANRGKIMTPHLLAKTQQYDGTLIPQQPVTEGWVKLQNPKNWDIVIGAMEKVVQSGGSAYYFYGYGRVPYTIASKTGTAEVHKPPQYKYLQTNKGIPKQYLSHSLFIAFAPADNPQIAVAAVVEHSPHQAIVVAKQVIDYYLSHEIASQTTTTLMNNNQSNTTTSITSNQSASPINASIPQLPLPNDHHE